MHMHDIFFDNRWINESITIDFSEIRLCCTFTILFDCHCSAASCVRDLFPVGVVGL